MHKAPLHIEMSEAPVNGHAFWRMAKDGVRIRVGLWAGGDKGTVLIFPGRTEYIEKYGRVVSEFVKRGYSCAVIDWRGQGLSERLNKKRQLGHVGKFSDYQHDVAELVAAVKDAGLPDPVALFAHSMGGAIGLRSLHKGLAVENAIFSAPMWGIHLDPKLRPAAITVAKLGTKIGFSTTYAPSTGPFNGVQVHPFRTNQLTNDEDTYRWMRTHLEQDKKLGLGGPSLHWFNQALKETKLLRRMPSPATNCLCFLGTEEAIVEPTSITKVMGKWTNGKLVMVEGAQHEIFMEQPHVLKQAWSEVDALLT